MSFEYTGVEEAMPRGGLRMVVVGSVPSPWGEAAKGIFHIKRIDFAALDPDGTDRRSKLSCYLRSSRRIPKDAIMFEGLFQPTHLILVLAIALIVFGPGKLPDLGKALGESIRELKKALNESASAPKELSRPSVPEERAEQTPKQQA
jgi:sec-independent protein translocase protein TatA